MKNPDNILRLKYRLEPKENDMVEFQILEQCTSINDIDNYGNLGVYNYWAIWHCVAPEIDTETDERVIYLRGSNRKENFRVDTFKGHYLIPSIHKALELFIKDKFGNCKVVKS